MTLAHLLLAALTVFAVAHAQTRTLRSCDDCYSTPPTALRYGRIYFDGGQYGAFSVRSLQKGGGSVANRGTHILETCEYHLQVGSNGHILLLRSTAESSRGYSHNPTPTISQTRGSPMIAGFWADINLGCSGTTNTIRYTETVSSSSLQSARAAVRSKDSYFYPTSVLNVQYDAVQRYNCPSDRAVRTKHIGSIYLHRSISLDQHLQHYHCH